MNHMENQDRLERIARFIKQGKTGTPKELAQRCDITEKTLSRQIDVLRQYTGIAGAKILYDRDRKTYYFDPPGKFSFFKFIEDA